MIGLDLTDKEFLTVKEAARYLRVSVCTVYRLCRIPARKGGPPLHRIPGIPKKNTREPGTSCRIRIPTREFIRWAKQGNNERA